jgi:Tubulin-tyrosine ligase family
MRQLHGDRHFSFFPECYIWPREKELIREGFLSDPGQPWVVKPAGSCQGKGIYITKRFEDLPGEVTGSSDHCWVVERYIDNPMLIDGRKFDLRVFVVVTSFRPLKVYVHREGLVRFASERYTNSSYSDKFVHLTNYSVNKHNASVLEPDPATTARRSNISSGSGSSGGGISGGLRSDQSQHQHQGAPTDESRHDDDTARTTDAAGSETDGSRSRRLKWSFAELDDHLSSIGADRGKCLGLTLRMP